MDRLAQTFCRAFNLVIMTALLAGCGTGAPRQYQTAVSNFASEECRALQSIVEAREQFGIVAPSRGLDEASRRCGLPIAVAVDRRFSKLN
jgi:hypothetical protein